MELAPYNVEQRMTANMQPKSNADCEWVGHVLISFVLPLSFQRGGLCHNQSSLRANKTDAELSLQEFQPLDWIQQIMYYICATEKTLSNSLGAA